MKNQPFIEACRKFGFRNTPETLRYFYHPDHIGSTSWVTDSAKNGIQYCEYLPFGEPFLDQRSTTWNSRYTFSGKERDGETGYSYFGARYYNSDISIWLSVDPLSDKYPNLSSYAYCANNPIVLFDDNGEEFDFLDNLLPRINTLLDGDKPKKRNPDAPNSKENPYELDVVIIKDKKPVPAPKKNPDNNKQDANVITFPLIISGAIFWADAVKVATIITEGILFIPLAILMGGDTKPGQIDQYSPHTKNASKSKVNKHTNIRSGGDPEKGRYGKNRNQKRGDKNKKHIPYQNPNKRLNP